MDEVEDECKEFFASKPPKWNKHGNELLAQQKIEYDDIYFDK